MIQNIVVITMVFITGVWLGYHLMVKPHISYRIRLTNYHRLIEKKETILGRWVTLKVYSKYTHTQSQVENYLNQIKYEEESRT